MGKNVFKGFLNRKFSLANLKIYNQRIIDTLYSSFIYKLIVFSKPLLRICYRVGLA